MKFIWRSLAVTAFCLGTAVQATSINWEVKLPSTTSVANRVMASAVAPCGDIILLKEDGVLLDYSANGNLLWSKRLTESYVLNLTGPDIICFPNGDIAVLVARGYNDGKIIMLDRDRKIKWSYGTTVSSLCGSPDDGILVGRDSEGAFSLDQEGAVRWKFATSISGGSKLNILSSGLVIPHAPVKICVLDPSSGKLLWTSSKNGGYSGRAQDYDDNTIVVPFFHGVSMFNRSGTELWSYDLGWHGDITTESSLAITSDGQIVLGTIKGELVVVSGDGHELSTFHLPGKVVSGLSIDKNDTIYLLVKCQGEAHLFAVDAKHTFITEIFPKPVEYGRETFVSGGVLIDLKGNLIIEGADNHLYSLKPLSYK